MKKIFAFTMLLVSFCLVMPTNADSAKTIAVVKKKIILEKTGFFDYQIDISYRTGNSEVIGVSSPSGTILSFTFDSASESGGVVTVNNFIINFKPSGSTTSSLLDVSGNYY